MESLSTPKRLLIILVVLLIAGGVCIAGGAGGVKVGTLSVFALCGILAFVINWLVFIPSSLIKSEQYFDLTGSITYLSVIAAAVYLVPDLGMRAKIVAIMVSLWTLRLGIFLFTRILRAGHDDRFDKIKVDPLRFFMVWTLQGLWVLLTAACALSIISGGVDKTIGLIGYIGITMWLIGFTIEIIADRQKTAFKKDPGNKGKFISSGLWSWSRHPNYFGEILLWCGVAVLALPILIGWQYVTLISPVFVYLLLAKVSGIPQLAAKGKERWGNDPAYQKYLARTSLLIPMPPKS